VSSTTVGHHHTYIWENPVKAGFTRDRSVSVVIGVSGRGIDDRVLRGEFPACEREQPG
jgi:hypothetical protein